MSHSLYLPYAVEYVAVLGDAQQLVVSGDLMEIGTFLIGEKQVRLPDGVQHGRVQVQRVVRVLAVGQPRVVPLLPQEDVHSVVLQKTTTHAQAQFMGFTKQIRNHFTC